MINGVVFDMDDTLYAESEYVFSGFASVDQHLSKNGYQGFYDKAKELFQLGVRGNIFNQVLDSINIHYSDDDIQDLVSIYRNHDPKIFLLDDAKWAINQLKNNYKLGLITDGYLNSQQNKATALHLADVFNAIIFTDLLGRENWKPSERPYIEMKNLLSEEHSKLIYIGDNPTKDFIAAKRLGWKTVHIFREGSEYSRAVYTSDYDADYKLTSLYDLPKLIKQIKD